MADDTVAATTETTEVKPPETTNDTVAATTDVAEVKTTVEDPEIERLSKTLKVLYGRIDGMTREKYALENKIQEMEQKVASGQKAGTYDETEVDRRADIKAAQIAATIEFNAKCNEIRASGDAAYGDDFMRSVTMLQSLSGGNIPPNVIDAAYESGRGADVLQKLGTSAELAMEILAMPPVRMASRIAKMAAELTTPKTKVSKASEPIKPQVGVRSGGASQLEDITDMNDWVRAREKQLKEKANAQ